MIPAPSPSRESTTANVAAENVPIDLDSLIDADVIEEDPSENNLYDSTKIFVEELTGKISQKLRLPSMRASRKVKSFEIRLWTGLGGLKQPKLLELRFDPKVNKSSFYVVDRLGNSVISRSDHLPDPVSGWGRMMLVLRRRLTIPKGLVPDPQFDLQRDETIIALQAVVAGKPRIVFYGERTAFPDGKRLIEVCNKLNTEFNVDLDCDVRHAGTVRSSNAEAQRPAGQ